MSIPGGHTWSLGGSGQQLDKDSPAGVPQILTGTCPSWQGEEPWCALPAWCCWHRDTGTQPSVGHHEKSWSSLACMEYPLGCQRLLPMPSLTLLGRRKQPGKDKTLLPICRITLLSTSLCMELSVGCMGFFHGFSISMDFSHYKQAFSSSPEETCLLEQSQSLRQSRVTAGCPCSLRGQRCAC